MADHPEYLPLYRALVEYAQDLLGVIDLDGRLRYLSPAARNVFGQRPRDLADQSLIDWTHPDDRPQLRVWVAALGRHQGVADACSVRVGQVGRWRLLDMSGVAIMEDPTTQRIVFSGRDVTERVAAVKALEASEHRFRGAFDFAPIGKALVTPDGRFIEVNKVLADMLGCWISELIGRNLTDFLDSEGVADFHADRQSLESRAQDVCQRELRLVAPSRSDHWGLVNLSALWGGGDTAEHLIVQIQDITDRRAAEQALRESNQDLRRSNEELKRFAYIASHDLREPLRGIGGSIQLLQRRYAEALGEPGKELAQQAVSGVKRLQSLLDGLEEYTEQMRGGELARQTVDTESLVRDLIADNQAELEDIGAVVDIQKLPSILGDPAQLRQIFQQLIGNAIKFRHPDRPLRLQLSAQWQRDQWRFCVRDNGVGIPKDQQERIFEVFRRLHAGEDYAGTGVGLATSRKIVEHHGGKIWVESEPGEGARFFFDLPPE